MNKESKIFTGILLGLLLITILSISLFQLTGKPDPDDSPVDSIKVMTYNIHLAYDFGTQGQYNLVELKELIEDNDPDIIGLQESEGNRAVSSNQNAIMWLAHQLEMYYYYGPPTSDGVWGVSLLSRWKIESPKVENLPSKDSLQRVAVLAEIRVPAPFGPIDIVVTHLDFQKKEVQLAQIEKIIDLTSAMDRAIIMGDFNTVIAQDEDGVALAEDLAFQLLNNSFDDAWYLSGGAFDEMTSYYFDETDDYDVDNSRIDYIWLKGNNLFPVLNSHKVLGTKSISDHRAIFVEITTT